MTTRARKNSRLIANRESWSLTSSTVELALTCEGGHMAPVVFDRRGRKLQPFSVAPWHGEKLAPSIPPLLRNLRGDFFCLPFGGNDRPWKGKKLLPHGETANRPWKLEKILHDSGDHILHVSQRQKDLGGRVDKILMLRDGHNAVYARHIIQGISGAMNFGHHATLKFPGTEGSGIISTSPFQYGEVYPNGFEKPENGGYCALKAGATFKSLTRVALANGGFTDLSRYPARKGFEDIVMMASDQSLPFAWTAVSFPREGCVWFSLKDPRKLRQTIFWISNGGRHYAPWNGRHTGVMGLEDVTTYYGAGIRESSGKNSFSRRGFPTSENLSAKTPFTISYIMACIPAPAGFGRVDKISATDNAVTLHSGRKSVATPLDIGFLFESP
ncbi:hypothetical protein QQ054_10850 [Oscillatoria amoena NRMC-F 0135]|nr:hypothetical protein [Oscillatoria laete-virens]MDL5046531.1 hypothetical protein [Oscillatoria amoena NRMC-F 0135]MDL5054854.1 hypothetical protein [Oscillatoria laete-virens NRMC-F 0139]